MTQSAKIRPKKIKENSSPDFLEGQADETGGPYERSSSESLCLAPDPVDQTAVTVDIRPPASSPPPNPGVNHEELVGAPLEEIRFRLKRHRADKLQNLSLDFVFFDDEGRLVRSPVIDFSERGLGLSTPEGLILRAGEILKNVEVHTGERCVYRGSATVVHHPTRPDRLGIKLAGRGLDVDVLLQDDHKAGRLAMFERHLTELRNHINHEGLTSKYRGLIADMVSLLIGVKQEIQRMEEGGKHPGLSSIDLQRIEDLIGDEFVRLTTELNTVAQSMDWDELHAAGQYAKRLLHPLLLKAPIPERAYNKPLGYAGDYLLMELIYRQRDSIDSLFGKIVNRLCCRLRAAKAVVARVDLLTDLLENEIKRTKGRKVRVGSMACGPAEEIQRLFQRGNIANTPVEVALIDQDREALSYCSRRMLKIEDSVNQNPESSIGFFHTSVKTIVSNPAEVDSLLGKFDVLYTVGLFDYLAKPAAKGMIKSLSRFLNDKGVLIIGNFAPHEGQAFMEHVLDWRLLYRSVDELRTLGESCLKGMEGDYEIDVVSEENETHLFMVMRKK